MNYQITDVFTSEYGPSDSAYEYSRALDEMTRLQWEKLGVDPDDTHAKLKTTRDILLENTILVANSVQSITQGLGLPLIGFSMFWFLNQPKEFFRFTMMTLPVLKLESKRVQEQLAQRRRLP